MNEQRKCLVGRDDDYGWAIGLAIALFVIAMIVAIIIYGGTFIGGFHSLNAAIKTLRMFSNSAWLSDVANRISIICFSQPLIFVMFFNNACNTFEIG